RRRRSPLAESFRFQTWNLEFRAEAIVASLCSDASRCAKTRFQPGPYVAQTQSVTPRRGRFRIEAVLHGDLQLAVANPAVHLNGSAVDESRDAVLDGVFVQRLQHQRRDLALRAVAIHAHFYLEARPEPDLFDVQVGLGEIEFLVPRDALPLAQTERAAQEVG